MLWEEAAAAARQKAFELTAARADDEARTLEFMAARQRSAKHEQRVKRLREVKRPFGLGLKLAVHLGVAFRFFKAVYTFRLCCIYPKRAP